MSKLPNFWQFFNLTSQPVIPALYWDSYSYEERIKKICDKIWAILNYLKLVMELLNEFDDRLTVLEELYNALEERVTELERIVADHEERITEIERILEELDLEELLAKLNALLSDLASEYDPESTYNTGDYVLVEDLLYRCNSDNVTGNFDENYWTRTDVGTELKAMRTSLNAVFADIDGLYGLISQEYDPTSVYDVGDYCIHEGSLFKCNTAIEAPGEAWSAAHWTVTNVGAELENLFGKDVRNIKFPANSGVLPGEIGAFKPLVFGSTQDFYLDGDPNNTNPYVVQAAGIAIRELSEAFPTSGGFLNPTTITEPTILYSAAGTQAITYGGHSYRIMFMLCDGHGNCVAYTCDNSTGRVFVWTYSSIDNDWQIHIDDFTEAADETTAASLSTANNFRIYYIVETPNT